MYYSEWNFDAAGRADDMVTMPVLHPGNYFIKVQAKPGAAPTDTYGLDVVVRDHTITLAQNVPIGALPSLGYGITVSDDGATTFVPVKIAVQPGSEVPAVNLKSQAKLPVAVLSSSGFDATQLDLASVRLGSTGTETAPIAHHQEDVNGDGVPDMLLKFEVQQLHAHCNSRTLSLKALTSGGQVILGQQAVQIKPCAASLLPISDFVSSIFL
jgi:hypothetical protein